MKVKDIRFIVIVLVLLNTCEVSADTRYVYYKVVGSGDSNSKRMNCAHQSTESKYIAARGDDASGNCEGLTWDSASETQEEIGYTYLQKTQSVETYRPPVKITNFQWLLPGTFGVRARLEFYISIPDTAWSGFEINIVDSTDPEFDVNDSEPEVIMVHMTVGKQTNEIGIKAWVDGWYNIMFTENVFVDGSTHKVTVVPHDDVMEILIDDTQIVQYAHFADPASARQLSLGAYTAMDLELQNITFIGA